MKTKNQLNSLLMLLGLISFCQAESFPSELNKNIMKEVTVRVLNKTTGKSATLKTALLKPIKCNSLIIRPRECFKEKVGLSEVTWSFIEVWVYSQKYSSVSSLSSLQEEPAAELSLIFSGWTNSLISNFSHSNYALTIQDCQETVFNPPDSSAEFSLGHQKNAK